MPDHLHRFSRSKPRACVDCGERSAVDADLWACLDALSALRAGDPVHAARILRARIAAADNLVAQ